MAMTGKYPPSGGWVRLIPEKIVPRPTPKNKEILTQKKRRSLLDFLKKIFMKN